MSTPTPIRWQPDRAAPLGAALPWRRPGLTVAMLRGFGGYCPCCGTTRLFTGWLRQQPDCAHCHAPLGRVRADDAPPYFVIFAVAHIVIAAQVLLDSTLALSTLTEAAVFMPIALIMCLGLLRPVKGATIGLMLQLGMVDTGNA